MSAPVPSPPPDASATRRGLVNTIAQSWAGRKTAQGGITLGASLIFQDATSQTSAGITAAAAASTYLTQANAASTYLTQANAASTYLTQAAGLTAAAAAATYLTLAAGLTAATAASTYLTQAAGLTAATAASTYLTQANAASTYLTQANAASTYLTQANAASTYQTIALAETATHAASTYLALAGGTLTGALTGTTSAMSKFKGLAAGTATIEGQVADGASAVGIIFDTANALTNSAGKVFSIRNGGVEKVYMRASDGLFVFSAAGFGSPSSAGVACEFNGILFAGGVSQVYAGGMIAYAGSQTINWAQTQAGLISTFKGNSGNGQTAFVLGTSVADGASSATAKLLVLQTGIAGTPVDKFTVEGSGKITVAGTDASGTPGAATINKIAGQVSIAAGASTVVVTNSLVSATSVVVPVLQQSDATLTSIVRVVPGSGTFTITGNANATAATKVGFIVHNYA